MALLIWLIFSFVSISWSGTPLVLATGEWRPYTSSHMKGYGEFTQKVSLVLQEMGLEPEYRFYPWARCCDAVLKGRIWTAFPYAYNQDLAQEVWFSDPLSFSRSFFFYYGPPETEKDYTVKQVSDLKKYRVSGVTGYIYETIFNRAHLTIMTQNLTCVQEQKEANHILTDAKWADRLQQLQNALDDDLVIAGNMLDQLRPSLLPLIGQAGLETIVTSIEEFDLDNAAETLQKAKDKLEEGDQDA